LQRRFACFFREHSELQRLQSQARGNSAAASNVPTFPEENLLETSMKSEVATVVTGTFQMQTVVSHCQGFSKQPEYINKVANKR